MRNEFNIIQRLWRNILICLMIFLVSCGIHVLSKQENIDLKSREKACEDSVSSWIIKHALYPESYQSLGFNTYSESYASESKKRIPNSENYSIFHSHKIKNVKGDTTTYSGYFKFEYDYFMDIIETKKSNSIGGAFPPQTEEWLLNYGKPLTATDSAELKKREEILFNETIYEINNSTFEKESDKEKLLKMLDTIHKK